MDIRQAGSFLERTTTGDVVAQGKTGHLLGFYVNSTAGGTLVLRTGGAGGTQLSGTITPAVGYHKFPADFTDGVHATIAVAALDVTFFFKSS